MDIKNINDFKKVGFKECSNCGWLVSGSRFADHNCDLDWKSKVDTVEPAKKSED